MSKLQDIRELAQEHATSVSSSPRDWMGYMDTAARLYRYPFTDQLLIHAQHPQATACASLELWNEKMFRWVNRGARGIALLDEHGAGGLLGQLAGLEHIVLAVEVELVCNLCHFFPLSPPATSQAGRLRAPGVGCSPARLVWPGDSGQARCAQTLGHAIRKGAPEGAP